MPRLRRKIDAPGHLRRVDRTSDFPNPTSLGTAASPPIWPRPLGRPINGSPIAIELRGKFSGLERFLCRDSVFVSVFFLRWVSRYRPAPLHTTLSSHPKHVASPVTYAENDVQSSSFLSFGRLACEICRSVVPPPRPYPPLPTPFLSYLYPYNLEPHQGKGGLTWTANAPPILPLPSSMSLPVDSIRRVLSRLASRCSSFSLSFSFSGCSFCCCWALFPVCRYTSVQSTSRQGRHTPRPVSTRGKARTNGP